MEPTAGTAVRELARALGRSPSTVSEVLAALRRDGLINERHQVTGTQLFWLVADRWPATSTYLARIPMPGRDATITRPLRLGLDETESTTGWALTYSAAALAYGAPLAVPKDQLLDFYVPDQAILRGQSRCSAPPRRSPRRAARSESPWCPRHAVTGCTLPPVRSNGRWPTRSSSPSIWLRTPTADARSSTPGRLRRGGHVAGSRVTFLGDAMAAVVQGVKEVRALIGQPPVVVGGLAVMCRLVAELLLGACDRM